MKRVMLVFGTHPIVHLVGIDYNKINTEACALVDNAIAYKEISKVATTAMIKPVAKSLNY